MIYKITLPVDNNDTQKKQPRPLFFKTLAAAARHEEVAKRVNYPVLANTKVYPYITKHKVTVETIDLPNNTDAVWYVVDHFGATMTPPTYYFTDALGVVLFLFGLGATKIVTDFLQVLSTADLRCPELFADYQTYSIHATTLIKY